MTLIAHLLVIEHISGTKNPIDKPETDWYSAGFKI